MNPQVTIRSAEAGDLNFVLNSWLKRYRDAIRARFVSDKVYYAVQHEVITKILQQPGLVALVACNAAEPNQIYGYVIAEKNHIVPDLMLVHWIYVKGPFRKFGLAKSLLSALPQDRSNVHYTHRTRNVEFLDKNQQAIFNPSYVWSLLGDASK